MNEINNKTITAVDGNVGFSDGPHALILELINKLKDNEKEVIIRRFGLHGKAYETLEQVGKRRGVTRERIRQIEKNSIKKLKQLYLDREDLLALEKVIMDILEDHGGLMKEDHLIHTLIERLETEDSLDLGGDIDQHRRAVVFAMDNLFDKPNLLKNHPEFHDSWHLPKFSLSDVIDIIVQVEKKILDRGELFSEEDLNKIFEEIEVERKPFDAYVGATKRIEKNIFGQWGITAWSTVTPKRVSDKAYLVMKKEGKPLHFRRIAELINEANFDDKKIANIGTVHNELIMDDRYVLIGRGIYALKEWGYYSGTVSDVIIQLMRERGAMNISEIIEEVSKQRLVRENTIRVVLMNKKLFKKVDKNKYDVSDSYEDEKEV